ncbi:MAG: M24 family metallopeptidase [Solirubrobacteraceae bacterium]
MSSRAEKLDALLEAERLDALLVSGPANLRYLTGYTGTNALALAGAPRRLLTDFRYATQAASQVHDFEVQIATGELLHALELPQGRIGFDDSQITVRQHRQLLERSESGVELVAASGLVERLRAVKEPAEIDLMRAAALLVDELYAWVLERGVEGRSERSVAADLEAEMRGRGAEGAAFPSIVASGAHGALPHAVPREEAIEHGTLVTIDIGAQLDGYCSDCTRTFAVGEPTEPAREIYQLVHAAQLAGLEAVKPGCTGVEVDAAARKVIEDAGYGEQFGHGLGHGVGLEIHERPRLSRHAGEAPLEAGNVVTVEPGVYLAGELGVRIEDLVVVGAAAEAPEILSAFTKRLLLVE